LQFLILPCVILEEHSRFLIWNSFFLEAKFELNCSAF
jgi:hypothetical protein